jgi:hypothetical protein
MPIHQYPEFPLNPDADNCFKIVVDVPEWQEDTHNPSMPGGPTIRPQQMVLLFYPRNDERVWEAATANVFGPRVGSKSATPRSLSVLFVDILGEGAESAPEWVKAQARIWVNRLNRKD